MNQINENGIHWIDRTVSEALTPGTYLRQRLITADQPNIIRILENLEPTNNIEVGNKAEYMALINQQIVRKLVYGAWEKYDLTMHHMALNKMDWEKFWYDMAFGALCLF